MFQISSRAKTLKFEPGDTTAHQFSGDGDTGGLVHIQAPSTNSGLVSILGVGGASGSTIDTDGPQLAAGEWHPPIMINKLSALGYKLSNSVDRVNVIITK